MSDITTADVYAIGLLTEQDFRMSSNSIAHNLLLSKNSKVEMRLKQPKSNVILFLVKMNRHKMESKILTVPGLRSLVSNAQT